MQKNSKNALIFFTLSFLWTWAFYFAIIFLGLDPYQGMGMVFLICGGCSPTFVGLFMVILTYSKVEKIKFFKRIYQANHIKPLWWLFIILIFPVVFAISICFNALMAGAPPEMTNLLAILKSPLIFFPLILLSFMSGPFSEELGWRGYALDPLLSSFGFIKASVLLGVVWGVWHLPLYFMPQTWHGQMGFWFFGVFILMSIGLSVIMSLVYINSNRSILSAMLIHLFSNFTSQLLSNYSKSLELYRSLLVFAIGFGICVYYIRKKEKFQNIIHC